MNRPRDPDSFEELLASALDPGEISLSEEEADELRASMMSRPAAVPEPWWITTVAAGECEAPGDPAWQAAEVQAQISATADFIACLSVELDPGEIRLESAARRELVARLQRAVMAADLTSWAVGELSGERREQMDERLANDEVARAEALSIREFCQQVEMLLPPLPRPGWGERRRLRRIFSEAPGRRPQPAWMAAAAVLVMLLGLAFRPDQVEGPVLSVAIPPATGDVREVRPAPADALAGDVVPEVATPGQPGERREVGRGSSFPVLAGSVPLEPAFAFSWRAEPLVIPSTSEGREFPWTPESSARTRVEGVTLASDRPPPAANLPREETDPAAIRGGPLLMAAGRDWLAATTVLGRLVGPGNSGGSHEGLKPVAPEPGSLALAQVQPQILSSLLRGPVSGWPDVSRAGGKTWISGDFQAMDFNLPSGNGGVEADTWRMEAGIGWLLSPSWHAAVSLAGIDSRIEVPGFGSADVEGAAFAWSLDWREAGWHAALTHTLGTFDQDLRRVAPGMLYPSGQDATVQNLSLWLTREFDAGDWSHGPVAGIEGSWGTVEGYREPFPGGVSMAGRDFGLLTTLVGWQASARLESSAGEWRPHALAGWRHQAVVPDAAMVQGTTAANFVVEPVTPERDSLLLEGGLRWLPAGGVIFFDAVSSIEWRDDGDSEHSLLFKLGARF